jgi:hypothetical protein
MRMSKRKTSIVASLVLAMLLGMGPATAGAVPISFSFDDPGGHAASADFEIIAGLLWVTLTNTSTVDVLVPTDVLTAVFFDLAGVGALTPLSATLAAGSTVLFGPDGGGNVGGEWAYVSGLSGAPGGATEGISSAGFDLFGAGNFGGASLTPPDAVNGMAYGLVSAGDNSSTGNAPVTGGNALIQNSVVFQLSGVPQSYTLDINNVTFQYGTDLSEPVGVAEPGTLALLGVGLLVVARGLRTRSRSRQVA